MAQLPPNPAPSSPANQGPAASPQDSPQSASETKAEQSHEKPGAGGMASQSRDAAAESKMAPEAPVISIDGFCDHTTLATVVKGASAGCKTVVTRRQFENLVDALDPNMRPPFRRDLARALPRMLLLAKKATEIGLDKDPRYAQMMKWSSLQMLGNQLNLHIQKDAENISEAEIEKYYKENAPRFEQAELLRIVVPKHKKLPVTGVADSAGGEDSANEGAMRAEAEKLWTKALAGADFSALQREAYDAAGLSSPPPNVNLGKKTRANLPQDEQRVFDLQAGQVSEVLPDPQNFYIYKVLSRQMMPLASVHKQIQDTLEFEKAQSALDQQLGSLKAQFNFAYFGNAVQAGQDDLFEKPSGKENAPEQPSPAAQTAQSLDAQWADSSVRSYLLEKSTDTFVPPSEKVVPGDAPVITIEGLCDHKPMAATDCQTTVTRADFEAMENAINPKAATNDLRRMADQYADLLMRGEKARQLGLENTGQYKLAMAFVAMNNRFKMFNNHVLEKSKEITDADLAEFYRENPRLFEEIKTLRLVIPQYKASPPDKEKPAPEQTAAGHAEMKKEAESVAVRAAAPGADFQALENEAWKASGYVEEPPEVTQPSMLRWETWPRTRLPIFDLKIGEVSKLIDEPKNGFYVYKITAKREVPYEEARAYIRKRYSGLRYEDAISTLTATIQSSANDQYFGSETQQSAPPGESAHPAGTGKTEVPNLDIKIPKKVSW